ncbi:hypothetical protein AX17_001001 [Amanita inopinata Kibby_2008]|nr:hypothetical protein AX17_001001 [Amanita inopinata Kibby_2008]
MSPKSNQVPAANGTQKSSRQSSSKRSMPALAKTDSSDGLAHPPTPHTAAGRPDRKVYDEEQERIKAEIDGLQTRLSAVREKLRLVTKPDANSERENWLRAELDKIRERQSSNKQSRFQTVEQLRSMEENVQKKVKDLQTARAKISFKSLAEIDARIETLDKQVESGDLKLADEKRALHEISINKRNRRNLENLQTDQEAIDTSRRDIDELKRHLDDPKEKAISDQYKSLIAELGTIKKERDEVNSHRSKLFGERDGIQAQINALYNEKHEFTQQFRDVNDLYWKKVNEARARREEQRRAEQAKAVQQKEKERVERLREEASTPAFQIEIEDCQTLIDHFSGKAPSSDLSKSTLPRKTDVVGVPKLELRKVEGPPEGAIMRKKGAGEESYYVGGKGKGKGKRSIQKTNDDADGRVPTASQGGSLNIPLSILTALGSLSIPPPTSSADVPRVIEDLKTKKLWFEANQERVTNEKIQKAEAEIKRVLNATNGGTADEATSQEVALPTEDPAEPAPTPQVGDALAATLSGSGMVDRLDAVLEHEVATAEAT